VVQEEEEEQSVDADLVNQVVAPLFDRSVPHALGFGHYILRASNPPSALM
jgi:hypothetical protein